MWLIVRLGPYMIPAKYKKISKNAKQQGPKEGPPI
jgi:hypothetical protein